MRAIILVVFEDGSAMVYEPQSSVRIANRGPSPTPKKDFEQVHRHPPEWVGFDSFEARILTAGHRLQTHRGLLSVVRVDHDFDHAPGMIDLGENES